MKFTDALLNLPDINIFQIELEPEEMFEPAFDDSELEFDFHFWEAEPINADVLSAECAHNNLLDGYFVLKAVFIDPEGKTHPCYIDVTMPERISEFAYFVIDGKIHQAPKGYSKCRLKENGRDIRGEAVPLVAIDKFGLYELYYSRIRPEIGIDVLRNGLKCSKRKKYIAEDLGYILRDENRYEEAIEAFSLVIEEGADNEYCFLERAALFEKIGNDRNAEKDRNAAKEFTLNKMKRH